MKKLLSKEHYCYKIHYQRKTVLTSPFYDFSKILSPPPPINKVGGEGGLHNVIDISVLLSTTIDDYSK